MRPRLLVIALGAALLLSIGGVVPAAAHDDEDEDEEEIVIRRDGREQRTRVLKEAPDPDEGRPARPGGLIVKFRAGVHSAERDRVHRETNLAVRERSRLRDADVVSVKPRDWKQAMEAYRARPEVESVEPDRIVRTALTPNDSNFSQQWGMTKINAPQAWDTTAGSTAVRVAVLDCGVFAPETSTYLAPDGLAGHPDLRGSKVAASVNFTSSTSHDDFCNHGTHVAGIAAANANNGIGVAGVAFNTKIVNVKVLGDNGSGSFSWIISGILWAAGCPPEPENPCGSRRAEVINMSLGAAGTCSSSLQDAVNRAWDQGLVIVAAAGNSNTSNPFSPANCNNTIAVSASTQTDVKAGFSNYGSWVDVAAPGDSILSTDYVGAYSSFNGTSMASPHVAGLAALVWTTPHNTGNAAIVTRILSKANASALAGSVNGRIDAAAAVSAAPAPDLTPPTVAINQASGQADPANASPINFAVVFSEPVTGFAAGDLTLGGTAPGARKGVVTGGGSTYNVAVSGMSGSGTVTAAIAAGVAQDLAGNLNAAATSTDKTVTYNAPVACSASVTSASDTNPTGGGTVTINVTLSSSVTEWRVQRQSSGFWVTRATLNPSTTTWTGSDSGSDPQWRIGWRCNNGAWNYSAPFDP